MKLSLLHSIILHVASLQLHNVKADDQPIWIQLQLTQHEREYEKTWDASSELNRHCQSSSSGFFLF